MKAIAQRKYGGPGLLSFSDVATPDWGDGEVLVRVRAAGLSPGDRAMCTGIPYVNRLATGALRGPKTQIPGYDLAGVVEAVGSSVTRFRPGDEVFGMAKGSFAEYAVTSEDQLIVKPTGWSFEEAAAVPESATVALQAVRDRGQVGPGQRVAIVGAGGGVGSYALQMAKARGAIVTGVCGPRMVDDVRRLGADEVLDYTRHDLTKAATASGHGFDVIIDTAGKDPLRELRRALSDHGWLVIVGADHSHRVTGGLGRWLRALLWSPFVGQQLRPFAARALTLFDLVDLVAMMEEGSLVPVVDRSFPLADTATAMSYLDHRTWLGKVVIVI